MHLKNWSVIYPDRRTAALAPAYDFVSTISYVPDENFALKYSRTRRFDGFSEDELAHLAAKAQLTKTLVIETARETVARVAAGALAKLVLNQLGVAASLVQTLFTGIVAMLAIAGGLAVLSAGKKNHIEIPAGTLADIPLKALLVIK